MLWRSIVDSYSKTPRDVQTIPTKGNGIWFYVSSKNDKVYISKAKQHTPSSQIQGARLLDWHKCEIMLELYQRRKSGEPVSQEAAAATRNQVYWYGIFKDMGL